jgi:hypothetical protein
LTQKIKALREAGLRAEHEAFSFMKRRVHERIEVIWPRGG